jgi:hypothetical protein
MLARLAHYARSIALGTVGIAALTGCAKPVAECEGRGGPSAVTALTASMTTASRAQHRASAAISCDNDEISGRISALAISQQDATTLQNALQSFAKLAVEDVTSTEVSSSRLPLSAAHQQMYATAASAERASGLPLLRAWTTDPWAPLDPLELPADNSSGALAVTAMRGEGRAVALNLRSVSADTRNVSIEVALPGFDAADVEIFSVNWTGNDQSNWAAAELESLGDASGVRAMTLLAGVTQQVWIRVHPQTEAQPGRFSGHVLVSAADDVATQLRIPLEVAVLRARFPQRPTLHFGGWDYIDGADYGYAVTETNSSQLLQQLQRRHVDAPWAHQDVMHWQNISASDGTLVGALDTTAMARWIAQWPDARRFRVYLNVGDEGIAGIPTGDSRFEPAVREWAAAWARAIRQLGRSEADFDLLLVDEPRTAEQALTTELWARPIRESGTAFRIWTDPYWSSPSMVPRNLIDAADTIAINLLLAEKAGSDYWKWAARLAEQGKTIEIYACDGPVRRIDPYAYYRLTAWRAYFAGASAISFWSFSDTGGSASDNEFAAEDHSYSPLFIGTSMVRTGKHMEAAAEGIQDAEYLHMLARAASGHPSAAVRARASELQQQANEFVRSAPRSSNAQWRAQRDTAPMEAQRQAIGEFLDSIAE